MQLVKLWNENHKRYDSNFAHFQKSLWVQSETFEQEAIVLKKTHIPFVPAIILSQNIQM